MAWQPVSLVVPVFWRVAVRLLAYLKPYLAGSEIGTVGASADRAINLPPERVSLVCAV